MKVLLLFFVLLLFAAQTYSAALQTNPQQQNQCPKINDLTCNNHGSCSGNSTCNCYTGWYGNACEKEELQKLHMYVTIGGAILVPIAAGVFMAAIWVSSKIGFDLVSIIKRYLPYANQVDASGALIESGKKLKCSHCDKDCDAFAVLPKQKESVYNINGATVNLGNYAQCGPCYRSVRARQFLLFVYPFLLVTVPASAFPVFIASRNSWFFLFYIVTAIWVFLVGIYSLVFFVLIGSASQLASKLPVIGSRIGAARSNNRSAGGSSGGAVNDEVPEEAIPFEPQNYVPVYLETSTFQPQPEAPPSAPLVQYQDDINNINHGATMQEHYSEEEETNLLMQ